MQKFARQNPFAQRSRTPVGSLVEHHTWSVRITTAPHTTRKLPSFLPLLRSRSQNRAKELPVPQAKQISDGLLCLICRAVELRLSVGKKENSFTRTLNLAEGRTLCLSSPIGIISSNLQKDSISNPACKFDLRKVCFAHTASFLPLRCAFALTHTGFWCRSLLMVALH